MFRYFFLILFSVLSLQFQVAASVLAAQPGITVSPSITSLDLSQDPPELTLTYTNASSVILELTFRAQNFTQLEDGWRVKFLEEKDAKNYQYSLSSWLQFEKSSLTLKPGEKGQVKVFVKSDEISPGGHYASLIAEIGELPRAPEVSLRGAVSALLFVRANTGKEVESGAIKAFQVIRNNWSFPQEASVRFQNGGNTQLVPFGQVEILNPFGQKVAQGILNEGSSITLPESIRYYSLSLKQSGKFLPPGLYQAKLSLHFGKNDIYLYSSDVFFTTGSLNFTALILALIIAAAGVIVLKKKF